MSYQKAGRNGDFARPKCCGVPGRWRDRGGGELWRSAFHMGDSRIWGVDGS